MGKNSGCMAENKVLGQERMIIRQKQSEKRNSQHSSICSSFGAVSQYKKKVAGKRVEDACCIQSVVLSAPATLATWFISLSQWHPPPPTNAVKLPCLSFHFFQPPIYMHARKHKLSSTSFFLHSFIVIIIIMITMRETQAVVKLLILRNETKESIPPAVSSSILVSFYSSKSRLIRLPQILDCENAWRIRLFLNFLKCMPTPDADDLHLL